MSRTSDHRGRLPASAPRRAALLVAVLVVPALMGQRFIEEPVQLRIEGYLGASAEQVNPWAMLDVWIERGPDRKFALMNIIALDPGNVTGADVLAAIQPIHPSFIFNGEPAALEKIATARPNEYLRITGYTAFGAQRILVTDVERSEPITGPTPTPTLLEKLFGSS